MAAQQDVVGGVEHVLKRVEKKWGEYEPSPTKTLTYYNLLVQKNYNKKFAAHLGCPHCPPMLHAVVVVVVVVSVVHDV